MSLLRTGQAIEGDPQWWMEASLRVSPRQKRSVDKVERILTAASLLLATRGYSVVAASPEALIEEASVSGGVFYRYFSNVEAVLDTLSFQFLDVARGMIDRLTTETFPDWGSAFDRVIDSYADFYREPAVKELWLNNHLSSTVLAYGAEINGYIEQRMLQMLRDSTESIKVGALEIHVAAQIAEHLLRVSLREPSESEEDLIANAKLAVRAYLSRVGTPCS